ncbi:hypothetical protein QEH56_03845, partial [Pelagicoccus enzymogenes]|uniref:hypothetical protein n=1 Tax=Pelagicoccus enzymogenes TaxID=2773457 RepID=UPI00280EB8B5
MKPIRKAVTFLSLIFASLLLADDIALTDGRVLKDARVTEADPLAVVIVHQRGVETVPFELCPLDIQAMHGYSPSKAEAERVRRAEEAAREAEAAKEAEAAREAATLAALSTLQYERAFPPQSDRERPAPRRVGSVAFGVRLGDRFDGEGIPVLYDNSIEYHPIPNAPDPSELFSQYLLLVSKSSRRVVGVEANGFTGSYTEFSELTDRLTQMYGRYHKRTKERSEEYAWRDGQMEVVLDRTKRGFTLSYR